MKKWPFLLIFVGIFAAVFVLRAYAHQPFLEDQDFTFERPWFVSDPTISTAIYATLSTNWDVDYYAFEGLAGEPILLDMTIPKIAGQENFAPNMALLGPGLPAANLPSGVQRPANSGAQIIPPAPPTEYYEPFGGRYYWDRQEMTVTLPQAGSYTVAVWHDAGEIGRYVFVIGTKEIRGGDPNYSSKIDAYWTLPVAQTPPTAVPPTAVPTAWPTHTPTPQPTAVPPTATPWPTKTNTPWPTSTPWPTATPVPATVAAAIIVQPTSAPLTATATAIMPTATKILPTAVAPTVAPVVSEPTVQRHADGSICPYGH